MKGLMIKDVYLLKDSRFLIFVVFVSAFLFMFTNSNSSLSFIVGFITFIMSMLVVTTISYDDFDHSNSFLMTLPVTRSLYVKEKYCFGFLLASSGWLLSSLFVTCIQVMNTDSINYGEWWMGLVVLLAIALLSLSLMIPVQLKFGGDKGRIAMIGAILVILALGAGIVALLEYLQVDVNAVLKSLLELGLPIIFTVLFGVIVILIFISYRSSLHIMKKKQF